MSKHKFKVGEVVKLNPNMDYEKIDLEINYYTNTLDHKKIVTYVQKKHIYGDICY